MQVADGGRHGWRTAADLESVLASRCRQSLCSRRAVAYSSEIQQPARTTAAPGKHPRTRQAAASSDPEQGRARSSHRENRPKAHPCHVRAITGGKLRSPAVTHGYREQLPIWAWAD